MVNASPESANYVPRSPGEQTKALIDRLGRIGGEIRIVAGVRPRNALEQTSQNGLFNRQIMSGFGAWSEWFSRQYPGLRPQMDRVLQLVSGLESPYRENFEGHLTGIMQTAEQGPQMVATTLLSRVDDLNALMLRLYPQGAAGGGPVVAQIQQMVDRIVGAMVAPWMNLYESPETRAMHTEVNPGSRKALHEQAVTIAQMGGTLIFVPALLFTGYQTLRGEGSFTPLALSAVGTYLAVMGPRALQSASESWMQQVTHLRGHSEFLRISDTYNLRSNGDQWAELARRMRDRNLGDEANRLLELPGPLTEPQTVTLLDALGLSSSPISSRVKTMMSAVYVTPTQRNTASDFALFRNFVRIPSAERAVNFQQAYLGSGASLQSFAPVS